MKARFIFALLLSMFVLQTLPGHAQDFLRRVKPWLFPLDSLEARRERKGISPELSHADKFLRFNQHARSANIPSEWRQTSSDSMQALWVRHYAAGLVSRDDVATAVTVDNAGNVYVAGSSVGSITSYDYATIKYNSYGVEQWVVRYSGPGAGEDHATALVVDTLGDVYVTGYSGGLDTRNDYATVKYNASGVEQWVARYNGPENDYATALAVDELGSVYVTGYSQGSGTYDDYITIKYNNSGVEDWKARYNGPGNGIDGATNLVVDAAGGVYVTGFSEGSSTFMDYATIKYNAAGAQEWVARYNGSGNGFDRATALAADAFGNVYVTGYSSGSLETRDDYATIKYNASGVEQWVARYNGPTSRDDVGIAVAVDAASNVYVTGFSHGSDPSDDVATDDYATIKYNASGDEQWVARYDGPANGMDRATALVVDAMANVYVTGYSSDDYATIKYNAAGIDQWVARYNALGYSEDRATALAVDTAGNVYVTGNSHGSNVNNDYATIKYNTVGAKEWEAGYTGQGSSNDEATALAVDAVGNVYVTGNSRGSDTSDDYATIKYNASGVEQWVARYDGSGSSTDRATALAVDTAGNVYVTGYSDDSSRTDDYATIKYNTTGVEQWVAHYNGPGDGGDYATALAVDALGNVYVTGRSQGLGSSDDYATIKYNTTGVQEWVVRYNGPGNSVDRTTTIVVDAVGNVYVTGSSRGSNTFADYATIKYNAAGVEQWVIRYDGPGNDFDVATALAVDALGNIYVTGSSRGSNRFEDYATIKYNASGAEQWVVRYDGPAMSNDGATALAVDTAGNIYVTGYSFGSGTLADYATIKYNTNGIEQWEMRYDGKRSSDDATALAVDAMGNVYVTGYSVGSGGAGDYATIKYNSDGIEQWVARYDGLGPVYSADRATALRLDATGKVYVTGYSSYPLINRSVYTTIQYSQIASSLKARTNNAANITATSATLYGIVNPNQLTLFVSFKYGTTTSYGDTVAASLSKITGTNDVLVSANLHDLFPNTTYHYRVFATYSGGLIEGEDVTFQTSTCAEASVLRHIPPSSPASMNSSIELAANFPRVCGIDSILLKYRRAGDPLFLSLTENSTLADSFFWTIPGEAVSSQGVEYYIAVRYTSGPTRQWPAKGVFSIPVKVAQGLTKAQAQLPGSDQNAYRLISMPLALEDSSAIRLLQDDLGPYDNKKWRFFALQPGDTTYTELSESMQIEPGKAYFLIVKDAGKFLTTGPGTSILTDKKFTIPLYPKWNFISNPFNFPIPLTKLTLKSGRDRILRYHEGTWRDPLIRNITHIQPFEGYAIFNTSNIVDTLFIDPDLTPASGSLRKEFSATVAEQVLWSIRVLAQCQEAIDEDNTAAVVSGANQAWDEMDQPEPPPIGEYVSVYLPHRDWKALAKTYCLDARPEITQGEIWDFEVKANIRDKVNLTFEGIESVPQEFEVWLTDDVLRITQNLRESNAYVIAGTQHPKSLKLVVGTKDFIEGKLANVHAIPTQYELSQNYPNPFNPATTIRYGLPQAGRVTLKIYNLLGAEVVTLVNNEEKKAGYHAAIWNGRDRAGNLVSSGVYVYRLQAGGFSMARKTALVK